MPWIVLGYWCVFVLLLLAIFWLISYFILLYFKKRGNYLSWLSRDVLVVGMILFNAVDWLTTLVGLLFISAQELNPVLAFFVDEKGNIELSFHILKLVVGSVAFVSTAIKFDKPFSVFGYHITKERRPFLLGIVLLFACTAAYNIFLIALRVL